MSWFRYHRRSIIITLTLFLVAGGVFGFMKTVYGVTRTWDGGGTDGTCGGAGTANNWSCAANWSADTLPTASDIASFDATSTKNVNITASISVAGINIASGYTGTITQTGASTITVGSSHYVQSDGTFVGGSGAITLNGTFTLSGGTFTSTSGTLTVNGDFTHTAGGTFNHNNGTVLLSTIGPATKTIDVSTSETFYNLTVYNYSATLAIASGDTLVVLGTFSSTAGYNVGNINTGTVEVRGNVVVDNTGNSGSATINFIMSGDQSITGSGGGLPNVNVNKPSGTLSVTGGLSVNALTLSSGTFTSTSGTLTVYGNFTHTAGGTFNHNNGTVLLSTIGPATKTIDVSTSETFYNLTVYNYSATLAIASGDTLVVLGTFSSTAGYNVGNINTGTVEVRGNVVVDSTDGSATFSFTGGNDQIYTSGTFPDGNITINKTGGKVILASNADWNASGQDLTITSGILSLGSNNLATGSIAVGLSGILLDKNGGDLTLGGTLTNSGNVILGLGQNCGGADNILIRSSITGTQRDWNGTGTFTLYDVDVKDMAGSAAITAYTSTNTGNNGANWTFSAGSCPVVPPAIGLSTGKINLQSGKLNLH